MALEALMELGRSQDRDNVPTSTLSSWSFETMSSLGSENTNSSGMTTLAPWSNINGESGPPYSIFDSDQLIASRPGLWYYGVQPAPEKLDECTTITLTSSGGPRPRTMANPPGSMDIWDTE